MEKAKKDVEAGAADPQLPGCSLLWMGISKVMRKATKRQLQPDDLLALQPADDLVRLSDAFQAAWTRELERWRTEKAAAAAAAAAGPEGPDKVPRVKPPSVGRALFPKLVRPLWVPATCLFIIQIGLSFLGPMLLGQVVGLVEGARICARLSPAAPGQSDSCVVPRIYYGYVFAGSMFVSKLIEALCTTHQAHMMTRAALRVRGVLISTIYRKCIWLSGIGGTANTSTGQVQNLMANDTQFFVMLAPMINMGWCAPIQIVVSFVWLANIIGPSFLAGVAVIVLGVPFQAKLMKKYLGHRVANLKLSDERVKLCNELVQGMRIVKMYAWEESMTKRIDEVRQKELREVRAQRFIGCFLSFFMVCQPLCVTVATFSVYGGTGNPMTASRIMPALSLFTMLRMPLAFLPMLFMQIANLRVALRRISKFLLNDELPDAVKQRTLAIEERHAHAGADARGPSKPSKQASNGAANGGADGADGAGGAGEGAGDADGVSISGSYRWHKPDVPVAPGKGKGKGKGKGGKGGKGGGEGRGRGNGKGGKAGKAGEGGKGGEDGGMGSGRGGGRSGGRGGGRGLFGKRQPPPEPAPPSFPAIEGDVVEAPASVEGARGAAVSAGDVLPVIEATPVVDDLKNSPGKPTDEGEGRGKVEEKIGGGNGAGGGAKPTPRGRKRSKSKEEEPKPLEPLVLKQVDVRFPRGKLTMVAGAVGSGKSSMLCALLGEMEEGAAGDAAAGAAGGDPRIRNEVRLPGRAAYFSQTPFILNETLRNNVLLGEPYEPRWYDEVVSACALLPDLAILPGGDLTEIGEKGINLSGGQKARIALARAVYARAPVVLLDDPLSAVDAHVGKHIFQQVLGPNGLLAGTTRVLVTHQTQYLPHADAVIILDSGRVLAQGTYLELREKDASGELDLSSISSLQIERDAELEAELEVEAAPSAKGGAEREKDGGRESGAAGGKKEANEGSQLVKAEERATGAVARHVYVRYIAALGGAVSLTCIFLIIVLDRALLIGTDTWLTVWISPQQSPFAGKVPASSEIEFWIPIYASLVIATGIIIFCRTYLLQVVSVMRASRSLYRRLLAAVISARMIFFETTPSGRVLNRFTSDTEMMDNNLPQTMSQWINCLFQVLGALVLISTISPVFLAFLPGLGIIYCLAYRYSASAVRDLQRLESVSRSPIFSHFSETLNGLSTIRAFGVTRRFEAISAAFVTKNTRCYFNQDMASQWVALRLELIAALISCLTILIPVIALHLGVSLGGSASPAAFGLSISYSLELSGFLKHLTRMTLDMQKCLAGVERILEYVTGIQKEPTGGAAAPAGEWPTAGGIAVRDMCVRYRPELPLALKHVNAEIAPRSKVGVVGRTGSGKTTFVSALWRLVQPTRGADGPAEGALSIDGVDLCTLELRSLRSRLAIIPQDPIIFNDSVRYNLDPFGEHSDAELLDALRLVQLADAVAALEKGLGHGVGEGGSAFSVGQRQLLCLARAMLRHSKVIVLDEATASIDNETDNILQATIRQTFRDATVLTIAHRLHTVMDSTQIMLFEAGELREFDSPQVLLAEPDSLFSKLVDDTGSAAAHLRQLANAALAPGAVGYPGP